MRKETGEGRGGEGEERAVEMREEGAEGMYRNEGWID